MTVSQQIMIRRNGILNRILGCLGKSMANEGILPLYLALVGPRLECCVLFWTLQFQKDKSGSSGSHKGDERSGASL